ncbi:hypothetical protein KAR28_02435 [Candidatus Parcubacteria bacterium]|nr:hypothetical protein [Candidatus Parcubacteria bacterium]
MNIKFVIRNKELVEDNSLEKIVDFPYVPPIGMVLSLPEIDEAVVDSLYCDFEKLDEFVAEVWLNTDENEGIKALQKKRLGQALNMSWYAPPFK